MVYIIDLQKTVKLDEAYNFVRDTRCTGRRICSSAPRSRLGVHP